MAEARIDYDVVVAGGGVAGVAAAVAAARRGAKTVLLEKQCIPGGLATSGLINIYLPLCDGNGTQVTYGFTEELMHHSLRYGPGTIPENWRTARNAPERERLRCVFAPSAMILAMDELLLDAGVEIWFDTLVTDCTVGSDRRLASLIVENSDGRHEITGRSFVDATGNARLAQLSGERRSFTRNVLSLWALEYEGSRQFGADRLAAEINMRTLGNPERHFTAPTAKDASSYLLETRALLRNFYKNAYQNESADRFSQWPLAVPTMPQFRKIAALQGQFTLDTGMNNREFDDSIGMVSDWRKSGPVWEIPFRTLLPQKTKGLFVAGRCISSIGDAWDVTRVIPPAALTGEAAGIAAALDANGIPQSELLVAVQDAMEKSGNKLHLSEIQ